MQSTSHLHLLTLPVELRLRIYELAYNAHFLADKLIWANGYTLELQGSLHPTSKHRKGNSFTHGTPYTLLRVCRQLYYELSPMLPPIPEILFHFMDFTNTDMSTWLTSLSPTQISQMRKFHFSGWGACQLRHLTPSLPQQRCERSLLVDLSAFEVAVCENRERFDRVMLPAATSPYDRQFYRGFFLLRVRDDCVEIPKAETHPRGSIGQCNSVIDQQQAVATLVDDEGRVTVGKRGLEQLLTAVMRDEIPGGPGRRHLE